MTLGTIWLSWLCYTAALAATLLKRNALARLAWTAGCLLYLLHVVAAFQFQYHWSHAFALQETERRAGVASGLYVNDVRIQSAVGGGCGVVVAVGGLVRPAPALD